MLGSPVIVGAIIASVLWQPQPLLAEPVLPEELASARLAPDTASKRRLIAKVRKYGDIPLVVSQLAFDYLGNRFDYSNDGG